MLFLGLAQKVFASSNTAESGVFLYFLGYLGFAALGARSLLMRPTSFVSGAQVNAHHDKKRTPSEHVGQQQQELCLHVFEAGALLAVAVRWLEPAVEAAATNCVCERTALSDKPNVVSSAV